MSSNCFTKIANFIQHRREKSLTVGNSFDETFLNNSCWLLSTDGTREILNKLITSENSFETEKILSNDQFGLNKLSLKFKIASVASCGAGSCFKPISCLMRRTSSASNWFSDKWKPYYRLCSNFVLQWSVKSNSFPFIPFDALLLTALIFSLFNHSLPLCRGCRREFNLHLLTTQYSDVIILSHLLHTKRSD